MPEITADDLQKYAKSPFAYYGFQFPNSETKDRECLVRAFAIHGHTIESVEYEMFGMMTWVLVADGTLFLHDKSHGGGGVFSVHKR